MFHSHSDHFQALTHIIQTQGEHYLKLYFCNLTDLMDFTKVIIISIGCSLQLLLLFRELLHITKINEQKVYFKACAHWF
jgi:hypothetical protein